MKTADGKFKVEAPESKVWFATGELSTLLPCCSVRKLMGMRKRGTGPKFVLFDRDVRYHIADIEMYLNENEYSVNKK